MPKPAHTSQHERTDSTLSDTGNHRHTHTMHGAPPIGHRLDAEVKYRPTDQGQGRDGLIFDAHHRCLFTFLN